jgi:hypothetical protein
VADLGTDVRCVDDLDPTFRLVSGREGLAQALARRLSTKRGELALIGDDEDYGLDVREFVGEDVGPRATFELAAQVEAETLRDERVLSATATASFAGGVLTLSLALSDAAGPFRLTLAVTDVSVSVLKVQ